MLSETEKFQSEVRAESARLIKQGVPPWEAAMQAGKNVQQKRKLTKRVPDVCDSCGATWIPSMPSCSVCGKRR